MWYTVPMLPLHAPLPSFSLPDEHGTIKTNADFFGTYTVVYFYPKDDTPGCTKEACMIRDSYNEFERAGISVIGVNKDSPESHTAFKEKYELPFTLLSDRTGEFIEACGAKNVLGGTKRVTYVVDQKGMIVCAYASVDPSTHALQLIADIQAL